MAKFNGLKAAWALASVGALALAAGLRCTGNDDGGSPPRDAADGDSTSEENEASTDDTDAETDGTDGPVGDGENCSNNSEPGCAGGLQCVQESPPFCSTDYLGRCEPIPTDCSGAPIDEVCNCEETSFSSPCEARRNGERRILIECP